MNVKILLFAATAMCSLTTMTACARAPEAAGSNTDNVARPTAQEPPAIARSPAAAPALQQADTDAPRMVVHKSASCGCCGLWVDHMRAAGFAVEVRNLEDVQPVKSRLGIPDGMASCHTGEIAGYFIEGHVPASDVKRLLEERPDAKGLVLPGMPMGSPGMEHPQGLRQPYTVALIGSDGQAEPFSQHNQP